MDEPLQQATLLGALQGLTEFLPISSSGHLALAQTLFGVRGAGLTLTVVLHAGTLLATVLYFRERLTAICADLLYALRQRRLPLADSPGRDALWVVLATVPTALFGLVLHDVVEEWTSSPRAVGVGFIATAVILVSTHWARGGTERSPALQTALLVGLAQGFSIFPGVSRSGTTIIAALWLGVRSERAFELSMLLSIPAVLGAVVLELAGSEATTTGRGLSLLLGAAVSFGVGILALALLRRMVARGHLAWFALWVMPLAIATLALAKAWPPETPSPAAPSASSRGVGTPPFAGVGESPR